MMYRFDMTDESNLPTCESEGEILRIIGEQNPTGDENALADAWIKARRDTVRRAKQQHPVNDEERRKALGWDWSRKSRAGGDVPVPQKARHLHRLGYSSQQIINSLSINKAQLIRFLGGADE